MIEKIKENVFVAFNKYSWKVFLSEDKAIEFVEEKEKEGEYWSITPATISFCLPICDDDEY